MNSKAVTLLSCGGGVGADDEWDEDEVLLADALTDATELLSAPADAAVLVVLPDAAADPPDLELLPVYNMTKYVINKYVKHAMLFLTEVCWLFHLQDYSEMNFFIF